MQYFFKKLASPASFCLFSFFSNKLQNKTVDFSEIRTRIDRVEGEHADYLTTTTALVTQYFLHQEVSTKLSVILLKSFNYLKWLQVHILILCWSSPRCLLLELLGRGDGGSRPSNPENLASSSNPERRSIPLKSGSSFLDHFRCPHDLRGAAWLTCIQS